MRGTRVIAGGGEEQGGCPVGPGGGRCFFAPPPPRGAGWGGGTPPRQYTQPGADGSFTLEDVPPGRYTLRVWHERSAEVARELVVGPAGVSDLEVELDARGFRWLPHKNKYGDDYPTDAARERY